MEVQTPFFTGFTGFTGLLAYWLYGNSYMKDTANLTIQEHWLATLTTSNLLGEQT
ncbi:MAG: hypothetical protein QS748_06610 [Candidatus Endonucleobacter bathymodioli]|uniref:Uncharacterized protein n=1 Tax=Candidatus Endonucleibacter bathymodioli TaxID=539814 RepID=A0AA90NKZ5_9GAMM|nr:hypothetical protein [Candidatus Endonucleobacter bathymodioli]